jgi:transposase
LKQVPGRKSDVKDCQWIAQLLQCGLLRSSFVPPRPQRELRDLTRHRAQLTAEHTRIANRIHKTLEDASIKLGAVASDILGKSGRAMLQALLDGQRDPVKLAELARKRLRGKIPQLQEALHGHFTEHHRFMLESLLKHLSQLEEQIEQFTARIQERIGSLVDAEEMRRMDAIPGVNRTTVENVTAEIGTDMAAFPTPEHLSSWAGMCPGNEESAGKRIRNRTTKGNRWLRRALVAAAWAASHTKGTYLSAQYRRLASRRGKKRALVAVAHSLLVIFHHMLKHKISYKELGGDFFNRMEPERLRRYLVKRLEALGFQVVLEAKVA